MLETNASPFKTPVSPDKHFKWMLGMYVAMCSVYLFIAPDAMWNDGGKPCLVVAAGIVVVYKLLGYGIRKKASKRFLEGCRLALFVLCAAGIPIFFDGSNVVNRARYAVQGDAMLNDEALLNFDEALLGWVWPRGQVSLFLDSSSLIGPTSMLGYFYTEILQVFYTSYYLWGNGLGLYLAFKYFYPMLYLGLDRGAYQVKQWKEIQMFLTAWSGAFLLNFALNLLVPAVSPRIYLQEQYTNELHGFLIADTLRSALKNAAANSFSAFPSGHCGLSWLTYFLAKRMKFKTFSKMAMAAAILITAATQVLRYHYIADAFAATVLVWFGLKFGGFDTEAKYLSLTELAPATNGKKSATTATIEMLESV
jgi:hypothetical protein